MPGDIGAPPPPDGKLGGGLNAKMWGLPAWGWIAIAAAGGIAAVVWMQSRKKTADTSTSGTSTDSYQTSSDTDDMFATLEAQIRDLQGSMSTTPGDTGTGTGTGTDTGTGTNTGTGTGTVTTNPPAPPTPAKSGSLPAPSSVNLTVGAVASTAVWKPVSGAVKYQIHWYFPVHNDWAGTTSLITSTIKTGKLKKGDNVGIHVAGVRADGSVGKYAVKVVTFH